MNQLNLFPLGNILLPGGLLPLQVFEPRYINLLKDSILREPIGIIQPNNSEDEVNPPLYTMGCSGRVVRMEELDQGRYFMLLRGEKRFHYIEDTVTEQGYRRADIRWVIETAQSDQATQFIDDRETFMQTLSEFLKTCGVKADLSEIEATNDTQLINTLSMLLPLKSPQRQNLLEASGVLERLYILETIIGHSPTDTSNKPFRH